MPSLPPTLAAAIARAGTRLGPVAGNITWFPEVTSTNDLALARAEADAPEATTIVADAQLRGRGRLGRPWVSPPGAGIYASILLRPGAHTPILTLAAGVAVAEGIEAASGFRPALKWPNDLYVVRADGGARKLGGILAEGGQTPGRSPYVVIGVGINVHRTAYPPELLAHATSLEEELGRDVDRDLVLTEALASLWRYYVEVRAGRVAAVLDTWRRDARETFGRRAEWSADGLTLSGVVDGIDDTGALIVRTASGSARRVVSGEVRWIS